MDTINISRRVFLAGSGAGAIGILLGGPDIRGLDALLPEAAAAAASYSPIAWVRIGQDNVTTVYSPGAEIGQGTMTSVPRIIAEDFELDWNKVRVEQAPSITRIYGNPGFGGVLATAGSKTVQGYYYSLRQAALQGRMVLQQAAAQKWGVAAGTVRAEDSMLHHDASKRRMTYAEAAALLQAPVELPAVDKSMLKPMSAFKLIGKDVPRVELPGKADGTAKFGLDVRLPGMLWASVLYPPVLYEKVTGVANESAALGVPGVKKVVNLGNRVAVVADSFFTARKARDMLAVTWSRDSQTRAYDSDAALKDYVVTAENVASSDGAVVYQKEGDVDAQLAGAAKVLKATYTTGHVAQTPLEPLNATVLVKDGNVEAWVSTQSATTVVMAAAKACGVKPENVKAYVTLSGGGYGGRSDPDVVADAGELAKLMPGTPIQVIWTREDTFLRTKPRPLTAQHVVAGLDAQGRVVAWRHRLVSESMSARTLPKAFAAAKGIDKPLMEGSDCVYDIEGRLVDYAREQRHQDVGFWRAVGAGHNVFASESFIDELAAAAGKDPLQFRLDMTAKAPRAQAVMREVAAMAGWGKPVPQGHALGLAYSNTFGSHVATVVDVSLKDGQPTLHRLWSAVDCGHAVSPANIRAQIEGGALFGYSALLGERLVYKGGELQQRNFDTYPLLRGNLAPAVEVKVIPTDHAPGGIGELGLPTVAPAMAAALFKLNGKRIRALPFTQAV